MKTTIDLPETLLYEAKVTAARRRTTLKNLVVEGLKHVIHGSADSGTTSPSPPLDEAFFEIDTYGVPVLKRRGAIVSDDLIEKMREEEGI